MNAGALQIERIHTVGYKPFVTGHKCSVPPRQKDHTVLAELCLLGHSVVLGSGVASSFSPGGKKGGGANIFPGLGQEPQKVISFYHFVQEMPIFSLKRLKGKLGGQDILQGESAPLSPRVATPLVLGQDNRQHL